MARRLGWLGPAIVALGAAVAAVGVWYMVRSKPQPGAVIDEIALDGSAKLVVRAEQGGSRSFVELHTGGELTWQALVPPYAGRKGVPAVAWNDRVISVRVIREGKAEIFALARRDAAKVGGLNLAPDVIALRDAPGPITVHDGVRSYELVSGDGWQRLLGVDLGLGKVIWKRDLSPAAVEGAGLDAGAVWIQQGGKKRWFGVFDGKEDRRVERIGPPPDDGVPPAWPTGPQPDDVGAGAAPNSP